jgi:hypothetical protein
MMEPMPLAQMPRVERLDLARVTLPADHPAADLGRSVAVHGFLVEHPDGAILVDTGVGVGNAFIDELYQPSRTELCGVIGAQVVWHGEELRSEVASRANVDPVPELQAAAVESIRRLKSLEPEVVHLSHCPAYVPSE